MSNPRVRKTNGGGGKTDCEIALFLRGFPHCVGVCGSSFSFALQFPLVRVCSRPAFRLAFAPSGVLLGLILSAIAFAGGRGAFFSFCFDPPSLLVLNGLFGLAFFGRLLEFSQTKASSRRGRRPFTLLRFTCAYSGYFGSINPSIL